MSFSGRQKLPNDHPIVCSYCSAKGIDTVLNTKGIREVTVVDQNGEQHQADRLIVTCDEHPNNRAAVAFSTYEDADDSSYSGWGNNSGREFLGFVPSEMRTFNPKAMRDPTGRGGGKFNILNRKGVPTVEIVK